MAELFLGMAQREKQPSINPKTLSRVLATDCGSTTTKAILFEKTNEGWRATFRGEAPTTVEKPVADVTIGATNAFLEVAEVSQKKLLQSTSDADCPLVFREESDDSEKGIDLYISTSSAGGGLQMIVAGVVGLITTESAERAALGAGAIVMDAISIDDGRESHKRVERIRHLRPDIFLIAGGTDGGTVDHPLELAETLLQADPRPRFGDTLRLPVIYAANSLAEPQAREILGNTFEFVAVENIRPSLDIENLAPARDTIHELFLNHVMSHAPGYGKLVSWSPVPIMPTPAAVGRMVLSAAEEFDLQILAVDIGGATTDVFSAFRNKEEEDTPSFAFNRTVSANLGMSYSIGNVMLEAGEKNIWRWLPFQIPIREIRDRLRNKMIRPTTIPQTKEDLMLEQAVCREALRLAFVHHKRLAVGLKGATKQRNIGDMFRQNSEQTLVNMRELDLIIGSGGVLSHAPDRKSAALMLIDAYEPEGVTRLAVDSVFMMPHLGVLSSIHPEAAAEVFVKDCLVPLGTVIAPTGEVASGNNLLDILLEDGKKIRLSFGEFRCIELPAGETMQAVLTPLGKNIDVGAGPGRELKAAIFGGHAGLILDGRGRPLRFPEDESERCVVVSRWYKSLGLELN